MKRMIVVYIIACADLMIYVILYRDIEPLKTQYIRND